MVEEPQDSELEELYSSSSSTSTSTRRKSRTRSDSQTKRVPIPIPERIAREGTPTQPVTPLVVDGERESTAVVRQSSRHNSLHSLTIETPTTRKILTETKPRPPLLAIASGKISPVVRSNTLTTSVRQSSAIVRSSTIETSGGSVLVTYQSERMRLLNSGPLAHYAYTSLFDDLGVGSQGLEMMGDNAFLPSMFATPIEADVEVAAIEVSVAAVAAVETAKAIVPPTTNNTNRRPFTTTSTTSATSATSATSSTISGNGYNGGTTNISGSSTNTSEQSSGAPLIDPRAYALSVPMDMFPELCERHLLLPTGHRGVVVPINWPNNPCSVIAKSLATAQYIDELRDAIEVTRSAHIQQQQKRQRQQQQKRQQGISSEKKNNSYKKNKSNTRSNDKNYKQNHHTKSSSISSTSSSSSDQGLFGLFGASGTDLDAHKWKEKNNTTKSSIKNLHLSDLLVATTPGRHLNMHFSDDELDFTCTVSDGLSIGLSIGFYVGFSVGVLLPVSHYLVSKPFLFYYFDHRYHVHQIFMH